MKLEQVPNDTESRSKCPLVSFKRRIWVWVRPMRMETLVLVAGFGCTVCAKGWVLRANPSADSWLGIFRIILPDIFFFSAAYFLLRLLCLVWRSSWSMRLALIGSIVVGGWSMMNAAWLLCSGVQLQTGIVLVLVRDMKDVWPLMESHIRMHLGLFILFAAVAGGILIFLAWRLIRPSAFCGENRGPKRSLFAAGIVLVVSALAWPFLNGRGNLGFSGEVLGFSSHWYALVCAWPGGESEKAGGVSGRAIPRAGMRRISPSPESTKTWPNIVLVLMESVSYKVVPPGAERDKQMPFLARLAREGVEFECTRVPVSRTTKAYWTSLTGSTPILQPDYVEAVPVDPPYESLATILSQVGYRSGFFEMSKGTFECAPGLFHNFGFDWAWFRENLEDPSAHIGYLGGDDLRLIGPAVDWAGGQSGPFLLVVITSISHDPYLVPTWFEEPVSDSLGRYMQTVRYTDLFVQKLYDALREKGLAENLLLCLQGDHGTSLGVDRDMARWRPREEVIRVPWVMHWPGHIQPGITVRGVCSQMDTTPTLLGLLGFDLSQAGFDGLDVLTSPPPPDRTVYFSSWYEQSPVGLVRGSKKYVYWPFYDEVLSYDLVADPEEMTPVSLMGLDKESIQQELLKWLSRGQLHVDAKRQGQRFLYEHWQTFSTGRRAWAYYVP